MGLIVSSHNTLGCIYDYIRCTYLNNDQREAQEDGEQASVFLGWVGLGHLSIKYNERVIEWDCDVQMLL